MYHSVFRVWTAYNDISPRHVVPLMYFFWFPKPETYKRTKTVHLPIYASTKAPTMHRA